LPDQQALLGRADDPVQQEGEGAQQQNSCENGVDVEPRLPPGGSGSRPLPPNRGVFGDDCTDEGEPHRVVEASEHPAERARKIDMADQVPPSRRASASTTRLISRTSDKSLKTMIGDIAFNPLI